MTDKVQKIREEVARLQDLTMDKNKNFYSEAAEGEYNALCNIEHFIDSLQEEPAPKIFEDMLNAKTAAESLGISQEEYDKIVDECLYGKEPELVDEDDLPTKKDYRERYKRIAESEEFRKNYDGMSIGDIVPVEGEEPVSKDLEEACEQLAENARKHKAETLSPFFSQTDYKQGVIDGSKWQKEQMMKDAIEAEIINWASMFTSIKVIEPERAEAMIKEKFDIGDKVKLIIVKEE